MLQKFLVTRNEYKNIYYEFGYTYNNFLTLIEDCIMYCIISDNLTPYVGEPGEN